MARRRPDALVEDRPDSAPDARPGTRPQEIADVDPPCVAGGPRSRRQHPAHQVASPGRPVGRRGGHLRSVGPPPWVRLAQARASVDRQRRWTSGFVPRDEEPRQHGPLVGRTGTVRLGPDDATVVGRRAGRRSPTAGPAAPARRRPAGPSSPGSPLPTRDARRATSDPSSARRRAATRSARFAAPEQRAEDAAHDVLADASTRRPGRPSGSPCRGSSGAASRRPPPPSPRPRAAARPPRAAAFWAASSSFCWRCISRSQLRRRHRVHAGGRRRVDAGAHGRLLGGRDGRLASGGEARGDALVGALTIDGRAVLGEQRAHRDVAAEDDLLDAAP